MATSHNTKDQVIDYIAQELGVDRTIIAQNFGGIEHIIRKKLITMQEITDIGKYISETMHK